MVYNKLGKSILDLISDKKEVKEPQIDESSVIKADITGIQILINEDMVFTIANYAEPSKEEIAGLAKVIYCMAGSILFPSAVNAAIDAFVAKKDEKSAEIFKDELSTLMKSIRKNVEMDDDLIYDEDDEDEDEETSSGDGEPLINPQLTI